MHKLSEILYQLSSWQTVCLTIIIYSLFLSQVMAPHAIEMQAFAGDWGAPDGHLFYTPEKLYAEIATWGNAGRQHYAQFRLGLDPLWALTYTSFLIAVTSAALRKASPAADRRRQLNLLPLIPMLADLSENFFGIMLMRIYPERLDWLAWLLTITSCFKWLTLGAAHLIMLYALWLATKSLLRRDQG